MLLIVLITTLLVIVVLELPRLILMKMWRELFIFTMLWALSAFLAVAQYLGMVLPNPIALISTMLGHN